MQLTLIFVTLAIVVVTAQSQEADPNQVKPEEVKGMPTIGIIELRDRASDFQGKVINLRVTSRTMTRMKSEGDLWVGALHEFGLSKHYHGKTKLGVDVELPSEGLGWYQDITTSSESNTIKTVFVRVLGPMDGLSGGTTIRVHALGREMHNGFKGIEFIWPPSPGDREFAALKGEMAKEVPSLGVIDVSTHGKELKGRIVRMGFSYRGEDLKNGVGMLLDMVRKPSGTIVEYVSTVVPPEAEGWYRRISYGSDGAKHEMVYVQVLGQPDDPLPAEKSMGYGVRVRVLGRQMKTGPNGQEFKW